MTIRIRDYPELSLLCWNLPGLTELEDERALAIYEDRWRFVDEEALTDRERALIDRLVEERGTGPLRTEIRPLGAALPEDRPDEGAGERGKAPERG